MARGQHVLGTPFHRGQAVEGRRDHVRPHLDEIQRERIEGGVRRAPGVEVAGVRVEVRHHAGQNLDQQGVMGTDPNTGRSRARDPLAPRACQRATASSSVSPPAPAGHSRRSAALSAFQARPAGAGW
jgi:hypothetical protein